MELTSGGSVGTLLQSNDTLTSRVDGKLKVTAERRSCDGLPHSASIAPIVGEGFDLDQLRRHVDMELQHPSEF